MRFIVATLAAEYAARGLTGAREWEALRAGLSGKPVSLGKWHAAARDLSLAVYAVPDAVLAPVASVLAMGLEGGRVGPSATNIHVQALTEVRNLDAHGTPTPGAQAPGRLAQTDEGFRHFASALRPLAKLPIWVAGRAGLTQGEQRAELHALRGLDSASPRKVVLNGAMEQHRPFVVSARGEVLYLDPLLSWCEWSYGHGLTRPFELRIFEGWKSGLPLFSDPHGFDRSCPPAGLKKGTPADWLSAHAAGSLVAGLFLPHDETVKGLRDPDLSEPRPELPGFRLGARLGHGGNGRVYAGRRLDTGEPVAVKVLPAALFADAAAGERLRREYLAMQRLTHRNIAQVYDFLPDLPHGPTLVMEHVLGENLRVAVNRRPMDVMNAVHIVEQVLAGLALAHRERVVHRDVTPENVLVGAGGEVKLIDFGIAIVAGDDRMTRTMDGLGKLHFAAPEQVERPREVGPPADVFAVGRLLGFLVSGSVVPVEQLAQLPGALQEIVRKATQEAARLRYPDAATMLRALAEARQRGWRGAPVALGDQLSPDCRVEAVLSSAGEGLWFVRILDVKRDTRCLGVVSERRQEAEEALEAALGKLSLEERESLGDPDTRKTPDGIHWCRLKVAAIDEVGGPFGTPRRVRSAVAPVKAVPERPSPPAAPKVAPAMSAPPTKLTPTVSGGGARGVMSSRSPGAASGNAWRPPSPEETGELDLHRRALPAGLAGLVFLLIPFFWPIVLVRVLARQVEWRAPPPLREPLPPYLSQPARLERGAEPLSVARRFDALAMVVLAQRHLGGTQPLSLDTRRYFREQPTRPCWVVLTLPDSAHSDVHRRLLAGRLTRLRAIHALRALHRAVVNGDSALPPESLRHLQVTQTLLHRLAHGGGRGVAPDRVEQFLRER
jgi:hypothetical protein